MPSIIARVEKLESEMGNNANGRLITVRSNGATEAAVDAFLITNGITVDHRKDQVVHLATLFLDRQDEPVDAPITMELLNVHELRSR